MCTLLLIYNGIFLANPWCIHYRHFNIYIGSEIYQVAVEPVGDKPISTSIKNIPGPAQEPISTPAPTPAPTPTPALKADIPAQSSGTKIIAPVPGIVLRYATQIGASVKKGDTILFLEAMKMENAIPSPVDGVVKELNIQPGNWVAKNDVMAVIE